jgi:lipoyltransferase 1
MLKKLQFYSLRRFSSTIDEKILPNSNGNLNLVSLSNDIYSNLALEQYIADNYDFSKRNMMFLWQNRPCVVIGRYQNPWFECNLVEMSKSGVQLARRYSGGGAVYHDIGNLNCTFFTSNAKYNRQQNLSLIKESLEKFTYNKSIQFEITKRHDLILKDGQEELKISGTSSRLSRNYAYHHCTVLFNVQIENMRLLRSNLNDKVIVLSKGTSSIRSKCKNLYEFSKELSPTSLINTISQQYWYKNQSNWSLNTLFNYINPESSEIKPLIQKYINELQSWTYQFGHTPKFQLKINIKEEDKSYIMLFIEDGFIANIETFNLDGRQLTRFTDYASKFYGIQLKRDVLDEVFIKNNLQNDFLFKILYKFFYEHLI